MCFLRLLAVTNWIEHIVNSNSNSCALLNASVKCVSVGLLHNHHDISVLIAVCTGQSSSNTSSRAAQTELWNLKGL